MRSVTRVFGSILAAAMGLDALVAVLLAVRTTPRLSLQSDSVDLATGPRRFTEYSALAERLA